MHMEKMNSYIMYLLAEGLEFQTKKRKKKKEEHSLSKEGKTPTQTTRRVSRTRKAHHLDVTSAPFMVLN